MEYNLARLGPKEFEHLAQALVHHFVQQPVRVYGAGPDHGRDASWTGPPGTPHLPNWTGYAVMQAKYLDHPSAPSAARNWIVGTLRTEMKAWEKADLASRPRPAHYLVVTNASLGANQDGSFEGIKRSLFGSLAAAGMSGTELHFWDYDQLRVLIDEAETIRRAYLGLITPGDVLGEMLKEGLPESFETTLRLHAAKALRADRYLGLAQSGLTTDASIDLARAFMDLPWRDPGMSQSIIGAPALNPKDDIVSALITSWDAAVSPTAPRNYMILGGPGQGKTTVGQFLCQVYRADMLAAADGTRDPDTARLVRETLEQVDKLNIPRPRLRRWAIRVQLPDFAEAIEAGDTPTLMSFIARRLVPRGQLPPVSETSDWLNRFPWLIVLDGLDEVPASSNRDAVAAAVSDFLTEAYERNANVAILATTRPQGYSLDLSPESFTHIHLTPLEAEQALEYGAHLVQLRFPDDEDRRDDLTARLQKAIDDPMVSRLMTTPLQVTIMSILSEQQRTLPRDRWRLFNRYFHIVLARELEKHGPISSLLSELRPDIEAIHRLVAYELQCRGNTSGTSKLSLDRSEFETIVRNRLGSEDHPQASAEQLVQSITSLALERLVFLVPAEDGEIGFDIASFQEYMAAEYIVKSSQEQYVDSLEALSLSQYWRPTVLFAIGHIFQERQEHRNDIIALCNDLNCRDNTVGRSARGAELAISILEEGIADRMPRFQRLLWDAAQPMLSLGAADDLTRLAGCIGDVDIDRQLTESLWKTIREDSPTRTIAALCTLAARDADDDEKARFRAELGAQPLEVRRAVAWFSVRNRCPGLGPDHTDILLIPSDEFVSYCQTTGGTVALPRDGLNPVVAAVLEVFGRPLYEDSIVRTNLTDLPGVELLLTSTNDSAWARLAMVDFPNGWEWLGACAEFHASPSVSTLVAALTAIAAAELVMPHRIVTYLGWPLASCLSATYSHRLRTWPKAWLDDLIVQVRTGAIGDETAWMETEARISGNSISLMELVPASPAGRVPFVSDWAEERRYPLAAAFVARARSTASLATQPHVYRELQTSILNAAGGRERSLLAAALLYCIALDKGDKLSRETAQLLLSSDDFHELVLSAPRNSWVRSSWLSSLRPEDLDVEAARITLLELGTQEVLPVVGISHTLASHFWRVGDSEGWPLQRLALSERHPTWLPFVDATPAAPEEDRPATLKAFAHTVDVLKGQPMSPEFADNLARRRESRDRVTLESALSTLTRGTRLTEPHPVESFPARLESAAALAHCLVPNDPLSVAALWAQIIYGVGALTPPAASGLFGLSMPIPRPLAN